MQKKENIKYSIIIPIFNTETYLEACLESLYNQTYKNYEVIMINDGSTDNSIDICKKYCKQSKLFRLINQVNSGVSSARNNGIKSAKGKYLLFIDSDDYIDCNTLEEIDANIDSNDLLVFGYEEVYRNTRIKKILNNDAVENPTEMKNRIITSVLCGFLCNKVYKKSIIDKNSLMLDENISYCEDLKFTLEYMKYCNKTKYLNRDYYKYRMRKSGASFSFYKEKNTSIFEAYNYILANINMDDESRDFINTMYLLNYYRLKEFLKNKQILINKSILLNEKTIIKKNSKKMRIKIYLCKYMLIIYKICQYIKQLKYRLYK